MSLALGIIALLDYQETQRSAEETEMYLAKYKCDEAVEAIKEEQWRTGEVNILKLVKVHYDFFKSGGRAKPLDD